MNQHPDPAAFSAEELEHIMAVHGETGCHELILDYSEDLDDFICTSCNEEVVTGSESYDSIADQELSDNYVCHPRVWPNYIDRPNVDEHTTRLMECDHELVKHCDNCLAMVCPICDV